MGKSRETLSNKYLTAIGRVTANFSYLEDEVSFFLCALISQEQRLGQIITAELSFRARVALLSSIFRHKVSDNSKVEELEQLLVRALHAEQKRNIIIHSTWASGDTPKQRTRIKVTAKLGKGIRHQFEQIAAEDINSVADELNEVTAAILVFVNSLPDELKGTDYISF